MLKYLGPTTLLERVIKRAGLLKHEFVLATSNSASDDSLAKEAEKLGVQVFRGSLNDVLARAVDAARHGGFDAFCRLCGDRPFMPLGDMRRAMAVMEQSFHEGRPWDLVTTHLPSPVPAGLLTEVIHTETLARLHKKASKPEQREHVTTIFYEDPERFRIYELETDLRQLGSVHLSVDTDRDRELIAQIIQMNPKLDWSEHEAAKAWRQLAETKSI